MADRVGQRLGNYRLIRLLGRGGFAEVYLGEHVYLKRQAAIKVLAMRLADQDMDSFLIEAQTIAHLEHPHIVRVLDFGIEEATSTPFLVMGYAPNGTMRQRHPKGIPLPLPTVVSYVKQVAAALQYAHDQKVIHRDVKPENMLLGTDNEILLSDFGIALIAQSSRYQNTQEVMGTAAYMAPEQLQGKPRPASDQYALGIVVYEWLCGERPFHGSFTELYSQHLFVPPPALREKVPTISPVVEHVVLTALAKEPQQRFARVQAFATALEQASLSGQPSVFASPNQPPQLTVTETSLPPSQWPKPTVAASQPGHQAAAPPPQSMGPQAPVVTPPGPSLEPPVVVPSSSQRSIEMPSLPPVIQFSQQATVGEVLVDTPAQATLGEVPEDASSQQVTVGEAPAGPSAQATTDTPDQLHNMVLRPSDEAPTPVVIPAPSTAPQQDGADAKESTPEPAQHGVSRRTFLIGGLFTLTGLGIAGAVWWASTPHQPSTFTPHPSPTPTPTPKPTATPNPVIYTYTDLGLVLAAAWSPNGKYLAEGSQTATLHIWDTRTRKTLANYNESSDINAISWSPDSKRIASAHGLGTVQIWDAGTGRHVATYQGDTYNGGIPWELHAVAWSPDGSRIAFGGYGPRLELWDSTIGNNIYRVQSQPVFGIAWSPDSKYLVSVGYSVLVWDAVTGSNILTYGGHDKGYFVDAVAWSPNGKHIASGGGDKTVQIWDAATGKTLYTYRGHSDQVNSVAWSPDGKRIASASSDQTVQVWDAATGANLFTFKGHSDRVYGVAWSPDGKLIASGSRDGTVQVWQPG